MISKKDKAALIIRKNQALFRCPLCGGAMLLNDACSLMCPKNHSFDMARSGYLNLLTGAMRAKYPKELFQARHRVIGRGFYAPLIRELSAIVSSRAHHGARKKSSMLDVGCGEGSHLKLLRIQLPARDRFTMIGADIAKEGIHIAAAGEDIIWTVADLTRLPFRDSTIGVILNILSPANYPEFDRLLSRDGMVIKVIPGKDYLGELRQALCPQKEYSGERVADYFSEHLLSAETHDVRYTFPVEADLLPDIIAMTPLMWGVAKGDALPDIPAITVDLKILVGKRKTAGAR